MQMRTRMLAALGALVLIVTAGACNDDNDNDITGTGGDRVFVQVERLANPLVSEVFLMKRNHGFHNAGKPSTDVANHATELRAFVTTVAGREAGVATPTIDVVLPLLRGLDNSIRKRRQ